jgi:hypothetical protein
MFQGHGRTSPPPAVRHAAQLDFSLNTLTPPTGGSNSEHIYGSHLNMETKLSRVVKCITKTLISYHVVTMSYSTE